MKKHHRRVFFHSVGINCQQRLKSVRAESFAHFFVSHSTNSTNESSDRNVKQRETRSSKYVHAFAFSRLGKRLIFLRSPLMHSFFVFVSLKKKRNPLLLEIRLSRVCFLRRCLDFLGENYGKFETTPRRRSNVNFYHVILFLLLLLLLFLLHCITLYYCYVMSCYVMSLHCCT